MVRDGKRLFAAIRRLLDGSVAAAAAYAAALLILGGCGVRPYIVLSGSMEPAIRTGSLCFIDRDYEFEKIHEGDVIAFETAGGVLVTHRGVLILDGKVETKGDANDISDGFTTSAENYRGKVLFSVPYLGYVNHFLCSWNGKNFCTAVIFLNLVFRKAEKRSNIDDFWEN